MVLTPEGERPIEDLRVGDLVEGRDPETGLMGAFPVAHTFVRTAPTLVDVELVDARGRRSVIRGTPEHRFWTLDRGWVQAGDLSNEEALTDFDGAEVHAAWVSPVPLEAPVYNIEVARAHAYFVGSTHALAHNGCFSSKSQLPPPPDPFIIPPPGPQQPVYPQPGGYPPPPGVYPPPPGVYPPPPGVYPPPSWAQQPPQYPPSVYSPPAGPSYGGSGFNAGSSHPAPVDVPGGVYNGGRPIAWFQGDKVYRIDSRDPNEIFSTGFQPRNPQGQVSVTDHAKTDYGYDQYVSTSTSKSGILNTVVGGGRTGDYVYTITSPHGGVDVNRTSDDIFINRVENEVAYTGGLRRECIRYAQEIHPGRKPGPPIPNPNYNAALCH
jgi:hypothetical protein